MLKKTIFSDKTKINLPKNIHNDVGIYSVNNTQFSFNGRYRHNNYAYEIVSDFEEFKTLDKALYLPPIPNLITSSFVNTLTISSRNPVINNIIKYLYPNIEIYDNSSLNSKCEYFIAYADSTPDIFAVDYLFNYKAKKSSHFVFYDFYPFLTELKSILDIVNVFNGTYNKTNVVVGNNNIDIYDIDLNSFNNEKWVKYLYWISSTTGCSDFVQNKIFNVDNYIKYNTVKEFFDIEIFKETV